MNVLRLAGYRSLPYAGSGRVRLRASSITVLDRAGILARACECYAVIQRHIERLLGSV